MGASPKRSLRARRPCKCCGEVGQIEGYGYRLACYRRWIAAGRPVEGPPAPRPGAGGNRPHGDLAAQIEEFAWVRANRRKPNGDPISVADAAAAIGVSHRTAQRYAAALNNKTR